MSGFVLFHRALNGHPAFRHDAEALAFIWMVSKAAWKPSRVRYKERSINLLRGQLSVSQRDMAAAMDRDKAWVERLWKRLKSEAMIEVASEAGVAVITICNYDKYQQTQEAREAAIEAPCEAGARQAQGTEQIREQGKEETSASHSPARQPVAEALSIWNEHAQAVGWPTARKNPSSARSALVSARLKDEGIEGWRAAIVRAHSSSYLGQSPPPEWFNLDWLAKQGNFNKLVEGNYDRNRQSDIRQSRGPRPSPAFALLREAEADERAERSAQAGDCGTWPALPALNGSGP